MARDALTEYGEKAGALVKEYDWEPGWAIAWFKEKGRIPPDAVCLNLMFGPGWCQIAYANEDPPEDWIVVGEED